MPRRPTGTGERVPLFLLPHVVMPGIRNYGEEVEWMMARKTNHHHSSVSIRTRPVKRELKVRPEAIGTGVPACTARGHEAS
jgi:hypothetical protein